MMRQFTLVSLVVLFFLWGLLTSLNDILVPHLKAAFDLQHWQAQLVQFFFFGAYFLMSWPAGMLIRKLGFKPGIVIGLMLMGLGCLLFYPASAVKIYGVFLLALFVLATGITILQVAANPYVAVVGPAETAASRLNLAQAFNSLGHTIAPLFGAWLILQNAETVEVERVQGPYIALAAVLVIIGLVFWRLHLPQISYENPERRGFRLWNYPQLYWGALAIFFYVGAEIAVGSFLVNYFTSEPTIALDTKTAGSYLSFYWGGAMIGRFQGAIVLSAALLTGQKAARLWPFPVAALGGVVLLALNGQLPQEAIWGIGALLTVNYLAFVLGPNTSNRMLSVFALINALLLALTMVGRGDLALWSILGVGLFNSVMWSNIFTLAISNLKQYTSFGSSLLVMMILGGALLPLLQGVLADIPAVGVKYSFLIPLIGYLYLGWYGRKVRY